MTLCAPPEFNLYPDVISSNIRTALFFLAISFHANRYFFSGNPSLHGSITIAAEFLINKKGLFSMKDVVKF